MTVIIILLSILGIMGWEGPALWRERRWKELAVFSVLLAFGGGIAIAQARHFSLLNPFEAIFNVFHPVYRLIHSL